MFDVLIIGAGPAGLTAGIYAARGGLKTAIFEKLSVGGQAATTPEIENYPGINSISGFDLTYQMMQQCQNFGVEFVFGNLIDLNLESEIKRLNTDNGEIKAKTVIITTGAKARKLGLHKEDELIGAGISYCATCDGAFFKNKPVAVVGGGNTAVSDALYLMQFASDVYLIHRRDQLRASKILADKVKNSSVKIVWDSVVKDLVGKPKLEKIKIENVKNHNLTELNVNGLFVAVGQHPQSHGLNQLKSDEKGYLITNEFMETNIKGVYAAGDIRQKPLRQVVTACSDGAIAADSAIKYLT